MEQSGLMIRRGLSVLAGAIVIYCLVTLAVVVTVPDLRLRFVLVDTVTSVAETSTVRHAASLPVGIVVRQADSIQGWGTELIASGDRLLQVGDVRIGSFLDYARALLALRRADVLPGGNVPAGIDPLQSGLPPLVQDENGTRWIRVRFQQAKSGRVLENSLALQAVPLGESAMTLIWFVLQLLIFAVGWLAFWSRPFDRSARLFFVMCLTTLGAFVGGFQWWITVGSFWLTIPFVVSAVLLPVIALHFFLTFPRPKLLLVQSPAATLTAIYAIPVLTLAVLLIAEVALWSWVWQADSAARTAAVLWWLKGMRTGLYVYLAVAALYFLATLASLIHARFSTRNPVELSQVKSILGAAFVATGFIGYTLLLAYFHRETFALGGGRVPMFLASLVFMLAYAVGIVRYKLMLVHQVITRGMWYYFLTYGATAVVAAAIAAGALAISSHSHLLPSNLQAGLVAAVLTVGVILALWLRDGWQQTIDRRFFREKYRLDKALRRINRAEGQLTDTQVLAERMLNSCRDVMQADRAALYLRGDKSSAWRLTSAQGNVQRLPLNLPVTDALLQALGSEGTIQRSLADLETHPEQFALRQLHVELIHALEVDGVVSGFVALGPKHGGSAYSAEDLTFLTALGQMTGVALHNAKVQQDLGHLNEELRLRVERISQQKQQILMLQAELAATRPEAPVEAAADFRREMILGNSPALMRVMETVRKVAASETSVLLRGESGTGKELVAHVIHENSVRRAGPFIAVHCAALAPGLLESELFGHVKGAFTGAHAERRGRFELAHGGTIFLDEIGDISAETQVKLLRVLQQHEFERVGGTDTVRVDVRIIAATHQNLEQLIADAKFREDLYYRLNVISITLPPLRERREDLLELSMQFLKRTAARSGKQVFGLEDDAVSALAGYDWPGNVRELENVIERAVVLSDGPAVTMTDLPADLAAAAPRTLPRSAAAKAVARIRPATDRGEAPAIAAPTWKRLDEHAEREMLVSALEQCQGNKARAARLLGLPRSTFFSKLKKFAIAE